MKKIVTIGAALVALATVTSAQAADLYTPKNTVVAAPYPGAAAFTWTGLFIGADAGYAWGQSKLTDVNGYNAAGSFNYSPNGVVLNLNTEYLYQYNQLVVGLGAELGYLGLSKTSQLGTRAAFAGDSVANTRSDFYGAITAKIGFTPVDRLLIYGKGGFAFANIRNSYSDTNANGLTLLNGTSTTNMRPGWTLGAGLQFAFTDRWVGKVEYDHYDFGRQTTSSLASDGNTYSFRNKTTAETIRVGVSYKLN